MFEIEVGPVLKTTHMYTMVQHGTTLETGTSKVIVGVKAGNSDDRKVVKTVSYVVLLSFLTQPLEACELCLVSVYAFHDMFILITARHDRECNCCWH